MKIINKSLPAWCFYTLLLLITVAMLSSCGASTQQTNRQPEVQAEIAPEVQVSETAQPAGGVDAEAIFASAQAQIEGNERDCHIVNTLKGDLDGDGTDELVIHFGCGFKDNMGNASAGSGMALFSLQNGKYVLLSVQEEIVNYVPESIQNGSVLGAVLDYAEGDAACCPSVRKPLRLLFKAGKLVAVP